jgi:hypothetical protein
MMIDTSLVNNSLNDLIRRAGINTQEPRVWEIMKFLEGFLKNKLVILYCDNIQ